jgi:amidase
VAAVEVVVERLRALGHSVTPIPHVPVALDEFLPIYQRLFTKTPVIFESKLQPVTAWFRQEGKRHTDAEVRAALTRLAGLADAADQGFDLLVCPTLPIQALRVGAFSDLAPEPYFRAVAPMGGFTAAWNVTGRPALTLPWGFDADGLPIGVQFVGRAGDDTRLLALARQLESDPARREIYPEAPRA